MQYLIHWSGSSVWSSALCQGWMCKLDDPVRSWPGEAQPPRENGNHVFWAVCALCIAVLVSQGWGQGVQAGASYLLEHSFNGAETCLLSAFLRAATHLGTLASHLLCLHLLSSVKNQHWMGQDTLPLILDKAVSLGSPPFPVAAPPSTSCLKNSWVRH